MENGVQITRAVQHTDNLDAFRYDPVKDNVPANREASQAFGQLIPQASHTGAYGQGLELFSEGIENASARASLSSAM